MKLKYHILHYLSKRIEKNSDVIEQQDNDNNYNDDAMNILIEASLDVDQNIKTNN